jgi:hypothetical protein
MPGWLLAALGAFVSGGLAYEEWQEGRVAFGTGMVVALIGATLRWFGRVFGEKGGRSAAT